MTGHRRFEWIAVATLLFAAAGTALAQRQQLSVPLQQLNHDQPVQIWHVQGRVYLLVGAGANIAAEVGDDSVVLVNAGAQGSSDAVLAAVRTLSPRPIQYIIDTNADADVVGGSGKLAESGFDYTGQGAEPKGAGVLAQLAAYTRLSNGAPSGAAVPTDSYDDRWSFFNDEAVILRHAPAAHSDGDSYVFFRRSDVIATGDLFDTDHYPVIEADRGGSLDGIIDALNDIIEIMVPRENEEGGTYLIPGHGRICDRTDIVNYRDALTIIRARVRADVAQHMSLQQVLAANPTYDYDSIYGIDTGPWTTRLFVEQVYREALAQFKRAPHS